MRNRRVSIIVIFPSVVGLLGCHILATVFLFFICVSFTIYNTLRNFIETNVELQICYVGTFVTQEKK